MGLFRFLDSKKQDTACAKSTYYCFLSEEGPNSITPFFEQLLEGKEISREDSLFWGSGESWAGAGGRGQELSDRYFIYDEAVGEICQKGVRRKGVQVSDSAGLSGFQQRYQ